VRIASWAMLAASVMSASFGYLRTRATGGCPFSNTGADTAETQRSLSAAVLSLRSAPSQTAETHARIFGFARKSITPNSVAVAGAPCVWGSARCICALR
jgi:hypothetical protein